MADNISFAIAGLGNRGKDAYLPAIKHCAGNGGIAAIADTDAEKVYSVASTYNIPQERCFSSAEEMFSAGKLADAALIATQDRQHVAHATAALAKGYHILLEKPVSPIIEDFHKLLRMTERCRQKVVVCHVLRYTPFYNKVKALIDGGAVGNIVSVMAIEGVGYWHQAHSFVRGNWNRSETTSPMILQKCCHDMDLFLWLCGKHCKTVSSFGSLSYFKPEFAPEGAAPRCLDGCRAKSECPFDAEKIYITNRNTGIAQGNGGWPVEVLALHPTPDSIMDAIKTGPYGRCVFHCDNDVVDHQIVNLEMTDGATISFTMSGLTSDNSRFAVFMGTKGELTADLGKRLITVERFGQEAETFPVPPAQTGHGGGDGQIIADFLQYISGDGDSPSRITSLSRSLESHYIALAAERSRLQNGVPVTISPE